MLSVPDYPFKFLILWELPFGVFSYISIAWNDPILVWLASHSFIQKYIFNIYVNARCFSRLYENTQEKLYLGVVYLGLGSNIKKYLT